MHASLAPWQNFYVIVGPSAAGLIGVQFVVIALIANLRKRADGDTIGAFGTPNVVHFGSALAISAVMCAPWRTLVGPAVTLAALGLGGLAYAVVVCRRARRQKDYQPVLEDWVWYLIGPGCVYFVLFLASDFLLVVSHVALFVMAGVALTQLFIGIRNAWDSITHILITSDFGKVEDPKNPDSRNTWTASCYAPVRPVLQSRPLYDAQRLDMIPRPRDARPARFAEPRRRMTRRVLLIVLLLPLGFAGLALGTCGTLALLSLREHSGPTHRFPLPGSDPLTDQQVLDFSRKMLESEGVKSKLLRAEPFGSGSSDAANRVSRGDDKVSATTYWYDPVKQRAWYVRLRREGGAVVGNSTPSH